MTLSLKAIPEKIHLLKILRIFADFSIFFLNFDKIGLSFSSITQFISSK
jgi:hypothetical protein